MYIGGVPTKQPGLHGHLNFTGCLENILINGTSLIYQMRNPEPHAEYYGKPTFELTNIEFTCPVSWSIFRGLMVPLRTIAYCVHYLSRELLNIKRINVTFAHNSVLCSLPVP